MIVIAFSIFVTKKTKSLFDPPSKWKHNNQLEAIKMLVEDIDRAKERIVLFGGTGDTYNNPQILTALSKQTVSIDMIFENKDISKTDLYRTVKDKKNVSLGFVTEKLYDRHFRVIDYDYVYFEKEHPPSSNHREYKRIPETRFLPGKYMNEFYKIKSHAEIVLSASNL